MYVYLHEQLDTSVTRGDELEKQLAEAAERENELIESHRTELEGVAAAHEKQLAEAAGRELELNDQLRKVKLFIEHKDELELELSTLREELVQQHKDAEEHERALERKMLMELDRGKKELLARMQETKEALVECTAGQTNTTTKRTMMENEHFMEELAFQSRESEQLVRRLDVLETEVRRLRVRNQVLEANEAALAAKAHYYRRILRQVRRTEAKRADEEHDDENDESDEENGENPIHPTQAPAAEDKRVEELERKLVRALEWLRVVEMDKQLLLARVDEVLQFVLAALDEGARTLVEGTEQADDARVALAGRTSTMDELVRLFPRPMVSLDELETRTLLQFLLEKLRVYQTQVAAVFHTIQNQPQAKAVVKRAGKPASGIELPPICSSTASPVKAKASSSASTTTGSPLKRRAFFAHVASAVVNAREEMATNTFTASTNAPSPVATSIAPELLAMATNQFNFLTSSPMKNKSKSGSTGAMMTSPTRAARASLSPTKKPAITKSSKAHSSTDVISESPGLAQSDSTAELLTPWPTDSAPTR